MHLCFLIKIKSSADNDNDIAAGIITVKKFFAHWIRKVDVKRYGDDISILLLTNAVDIYRYSDEHLKHLLEKALKWFVIQQKKVIFPDHADRRDHHTGNGQNSNHTTDENLTDGIRKLENQLKNECVYRILMKYLCNLGLICKLIQNIS